MPKKVLIVAYYWPPAGGPGVQRWLKFIKYLPQFGIEPIVVVPDNATYPLTDLSLTAEVPKGVTVLKIPIKEPYKIAKLFSKKKTATISKGVISTAQKQSFVEQLMLFVRGNFFIPDARMGWVKPVTKFLLEYIPKHKIKTVITTGPPHSLHLIGLNLKQKITIKWLADFRDPWTTIGYHKQLKLTAASQKKHKAYEKEVLCTADTVIVTSAVTKFEFESITTKPIHVITNGFDDETVAPFTLDKAFTIAHIGSLLSKRNPELLWEALSDLTLEHSGFKDDFQLNLVGFVSEDVLVSLEKHNLTPYLNKVGYVSHKEAINFQKKSQLLLLIEIDSKDTRCIIPGKLFEYMVSGRPIVALGPEGSDVAQILKATQTGNYFSYLDKHALKKIIFEHYTAYAKGELNVQPLDLQKYHRKQLTKTLSQLV